MRRVLVGTDGSPTAARVVERAVTLAASVGAELHVVAVVVAPQVGGALGAAGAATLGVRHASEEQRAARTLSDAESLAQAAGVAAVTHLEHGDPAARIVAVAQQVGADLVAVGSRGMGPAGRYALGSVPEQVLLGAGCDVLVVRTS